MDEAQVHELIATADRLAAEVRSLLPALAEARRRYFQTRDDADLAHLEAVQDEASALQAEFSATIEQMGELVPPEWPENRNPARAGDPEDRLSPGMLTADQIHTTANVDDIVPDALDAHRRVPGQRLHEVRSLAKCEGPLSDWASISASGGFR